MSPLRLNGSTSGYSQLDAPAVAGDQTFTLPGTGGVIDRLNRAGNVLQVVSNTYGTQVSTTSTTYVDTGLSASITPSSSSSKIIISYSQVFSASSFKGGTNGLEHNGNAAIQLLRGSTPITNVNDTVSLGSYSYGRSDGGNVVIWSTISQVVLDAPSTTNAVTYKTRFRIVNVASSNGAAANEVGTTAFITLMEVAA